MEPTTHTTPARLAAFASTAVGGVLIGLGSVMTWATVSLRGGSGPPVDGRGTDALQGALVLALGVGIVLAFLLLTVVPAPFRRIIGAAIVVAALVSGGLTLTTLSDLDGTVGLGAVEREAGELSDDLARELRRLTSTERGPGGLVALAGSAIALAGGVLTLRWVTKDPTGEGLGAGA
jgi:hypothetical protein